MSPERWAKSYNNLLSRFYSLRIARRHLSDYLVAPCFIDGEIEDLEWFNEPLRHFPLDMYPSMSTHQALKSAGLILHDLDKENCVGIVDLFISFHLLLYPRKSSDMPSSQPAAQFTLPVGPTCALPSWWYLWKCGPCPGLFLGLF